jgi:hypothetical protein
MKEIVVEVSAAMGAASSLQSPPTRTWNCSAWEYMSTTHRNASTRPKGS